eukprot:GSMAST32.ASY1.ANO1.2113.1 assembled CDS
MLKFHEEIDETTTKICSQLRVGDIVSKDCEAALSKIQYTNEELDNDIPDTSDIAQFVLIAPVLKVAVEAAYESGFAHLPSVKKGMSTLLSLQECLDRHTVKTEEKQLIDAQTKLHNVNPLENICNGEKKRPLLLGDYDSENPQTEIIHTGKDNLNSKPIISTNATPTDVEVMVARAAQLGVDEAEARKVVFDRMLAHDIEMKKLLVTQRTDRVQWERTQREINRRASELRKDDRQKWFADAEAKRLHAEKKARAWEKECRKKQLRHREFIESEDRRHAAILSQQREEQAKKALEIKRREFFLNRQKIERRVMTLTLKLFQMDLIMVLLLDVIILWSSLQSYGLFADQCVEDEFGRIVVGNNIFFHFLSTFAVAGSVCKILHVRFHHRCHLFFSYEILYLTNFKRRKYFSKKQATQLVLAVFAFICINAVLGRISPQFSFITFVSFLLYI